MRRTTIILPEGLERRTLEKARADGISFAEFVRRAVELALNEPPSRASQRKRRAAIEAMRAFRAEAPSAGPADLAINIDESIYEAVTRVTPVQFLPARSPSTPPPAAASRGKCGGAGRAGGQPKVVLNDPPRNA